ncbi:hypothetical protein GSI_10307 [Ganoderma sinense ZZ0214-1]|uniref:RlpA-like protein double-psi beta-barrel domain-containing protein n=1 Tax=Ganoderma sinense ZZ0214-1 TaxID=1077348 RepID=A0A2G8S088_9APHY|nr:hypothetical protein GSI_10307 [Ganoderma sinense ZZ0214-1]
MRFAAIFHVALSAATSGFALSKKGGDGMHSFASLVLFLIVDAHLIIHPATYYNPGLGSCGISSSDSQLVVAVDAQTIQAFPGAGSNPNLNPMCGRKLKVTYQKKSVTVTVVDTCPATSCTRTMSTKPAKDKEVGFFVLPELVEGKELQLVLQPTGSSLSAAAVPHSSRDLSLESPVTETPSSSSPSPETISSSFAGASFLPKETNSSSSTKIDSSSPTTSEISFSSSVEATLPSSFSKINLSLLLELVLSRDALSLTRLHQRPNATSFLPRSLRSRAPRFLPYKRVTSAEG